MADDFNYEYNHEDGQDSEEALKSWIPTVIMMFCFFPVGIFMLIYKLFGLSGQSVGRKRKSTARHPYDIERERAKQEARATVHEAKQQARAAAEEAKQEARATVYEAKQQARAAADEVRQSVDAARESIRVTADAFRPRQKAGGSKGAEGGNPTRPTAKGKQSGRKAEPARAESGQGLMTGGAITAAIMGFVAFAGFVETIRFGGLSALVSGAGLEEVFFPLGICGAGLVMLYYGLQKRKKARRHRKYLALIGKRENISVISLAQAMGVSVHRACDDLQDMLDEGLFPVGFLDMGSGRLILNDEGLRDEPVQRAEHAKAAEEPEAPSGMEREDRVLMEIRAVNDSIDDEEMTRKIDRIGEITGKIFGYLRGKPDKEGQLRSFLSYYLPTTLKILRAYAQMEDQGIEGENITAAKARIEGMMDKVVDGFEKQLDKLFQDDAMDITTDVAVLERMLDKDGLGGGQGLTLGG